MNLLSHRLILPGKDFPHIFRPARGRAVMVGRFQVLEVDVTLEGPADVVASIDAAYARFKISANSPGPSHRVALPRMAPDEGGTLYGRFLATILAQVERRAVFHAAALVDRRGRALVLAGPSGHGKSSLALEMVRRGFRFLGDDYAPVDLGSGSVLPFPRTASVVLGGAAPLPEAVRREAEATGTPRLFGKALVDVGRAFGPGAMAPGPAPLRTVVVLAPGDHDPAEAVSWLQMAARPAEAERLAAALREVPGVVVEAEAEGPSSHLWRLRLEHVEGPTERLAPLVEDDAVLYCERSWSGSPDFGAAPAIEPLKRREAAVFLTRELLNRRRGSKFLEGRGGDAADLVLEVAQALRPARCWRLRVGRFDETADLLEAAAEGDGETA
jgi:hypothetical protein